jgi:aminopeptidase N
MLCFYVIINGSDWIRKLMDKQIICIGGGGFGRNPQQRIIENYIINQSTITNPNILFIPTASAEDKSYIVNFYSCFSRLNCKPYHINFFERTPRIEGIINKANIIFVGGGNTKSMLAVWKEWKLDKLLMKAYNRGVVLSGVSAGAICWFETGVTDSWASNLNIIDCLGMLKGSCCPHYNSEKNRRPSVHKYITEKRLSSVYAIEDGAAVHFKNDVAYKNISFIEDAKVFKVKGYQDMVKENAQKMYSLL